MRGKRSAGASQCAWVANFRDARMQSGKRQADDLISDKAAEGLLQTVLYSAYASGRTCLSKLGDQACTRMLAAGIPCSKHELVLQIWDGIYLHRLPAAKIIMTQEYLNFAQQVMSSHDRANKQAEMNVTPAMGDRMTEMQGCLKQLCGSSVAGDPEAAAQLIAEKVAAMKIRRSRQDSDGDVLTSTSTSSNASSTSACGSFSRGQSMRH